MLRSLFISIPLCFSSYFTLLCHSPSSHMLIARTHGRNYAARIMKLESRDKVSKSENEKLHTSLEAKGNEKKGCLKVDEIRFGRVEGIVGGVVIDYSVNGIRLKIHRSTRTSWEYVQQPKWFIEMNERCLRDFWYGNQFLFGRIFVCGRLEDWSISVGIANWPIELLF